MADIHFQICQADRVSNVTKLYNCSKAYRAVGIVHDCIWLKDRNEITIKV